MSQGTKAKVIPNSEPSVNLNNYTAPFRCKMLNVHKTGSFRLILSHVVISHSAADFCGSQGFNSSSSNNTSKRESHASPVTTCRLGPAVSSTMADQFISQSAMLITTSLVAFLSGFGLGVYSIRGYLISPDLAEQRRRNLKDPVESDESDIDEDDTVLDHAPNWANGKEADKRDGLAIKKDKEKAQRKEASTLASSNEECKLVLVVRTDLGMTKGKLVISDSRVGRNCALRHFETRRS